MQVGGSGALGWARCRHAAPIWGHAGNAMVGTAALPPLTGAYHLDWLPGAGLATGFPERATTVLCIFQA